LDVHLPSAEPLSSLARFIAIAVLFSGSGDAVAQSAVNLAITNVNVVDVRAGIVLPERTVWIAGDRIMGVAPADQFSLPPGTTVIDASGGFVIPGLWDMHAHLRGNGTPPWLTTDWLMPMVLAHGVTGVRDMTSDCDGPSQGPVCLSQMLEWQESIESGALLGPRLMALSSFQINPPWGYEVSEEEARGVVRALAGMGVANLKIYDRLSPEAFAWIADEASKLGLGVWGHVPLRVSAREASRRGMRSIEHARDFLFDCFPGTEEFRANARSSTPAVDLMRRMVDEHDERGCAALFAELAANGTWYVPTHVTRRRDAFAGDREFREDPRVRFMLPDIQADFVRHMDRVVAADSAAEGATFMDFYLKGLAITGAAHRAGIPIMVGSDAPDPFVFPGSAVHDEMAELVAAGLSPAEALRAATWNGAVFLGATDSYGSVEPGKRADLVILDANPLDDIGNTRHIRALLFGGRYLDRDALDDLLDRAVEATTRPLAPGG
jgi:hypothetical protein